MTPGSPEIAVEFERDTVGSPSILLNIIATMTVVAIISATRTLKIAMIAVTPVFTCPGMSANCPSPYPILAIDPIFL